MDYPLRRRSRRLPDDEALDVLRRCTWGFLSLVGPDGAPYGVPLNHALQEDAAGRRLVFHCAREGRKLDCLRSCPRASFVAVEGAEGGPGAAPQAVQLAAPFVAVEGAETLPDKFSTAYASVLVSGPVAVVDEPAAKRELLRFLVGRLAPDHAERGEKHIAHRLDDCLALVLDIESLCGKRRPKADPYALAHLGF